jgi:dihydropteroate synthase
MTTTIARSEPENGDALGLRRPLLMGALNLTPDSFYALSRSGSAEAALRAGLKMEEDGADMLDLGGESTRPGAEPVSDEEETRRVVPAISALAGRVKIPISIDTSKAAVARRALEAGAVILNDVTALLGDPKMPAIARRYRTIVLMHMQGRPKTMQEDPRYGDVVGEILDFLRERITAFQKEGGDSARVWIDPGIGFGKTAEQNVEILRRLEEFLAPGRPLLLGASRKSFIGAVAGGSDRPLPPELRLEGSLAVACRAAAAGAHALRVHDVAETRRALEVFARVWTPPQRREND